MKTVGRWPGLLATFSIFEVLFTTFLQDLATKIVDNNNKNSNNNNSNNNNNNNNNNNKINNHNKYDNDDNIDDDNIRKNDNVLYLS